MRHSGKAMRAGLRLIFWTLVLLLAVLAGGIIATFVGGIIATLATAFIGVWLLCALFTLFFFRDPTPHGPSIPNAIVSPAHGKVDLIDETEEPVFRRGACKRISIFLSLMDVHVQKGPVRGTVSYLKHVQEEFGGAGRAKSARHHESVLIGFHPAEAPGEKVAVRLIAGRMTRRILPWVEQGETIERSERIGMIQFGSRCDLYLPLTAKVHVAVGDKVKGGETIVASFV